MLMLAFATETKLNLSLDAASGKAACLLVEQTGGCLKVSTILVSPNGAYIGDHPWRLLVLVLLEVDPNEELFQLPYLPMR